MSGNMILDDTIRNEFGGDDIENLLYQTEDALKDFHFDGSGYQLKVNLINSSSNPDPVYNKLGDSGFDLRANLPHGQIIMEPNSISLIPTGLFFKVPFNFELQIRPRSGIALKNGVTVLNSPGTCDSNYTGEVKIILYNTGAIGQFVINHGDRIAQGVLASVVHNAFFVKVDKLEETDRGENGFGSTLIK